MIPYLRYKNMDNSTLTDNYYLIIKLFWVRTEVPEFENLGENAGVQTVNKSPIESRLSNMIGGNTKDKWWLWKYLQSMRRWRLSFVLFCFLKTNKYKFHFVGTFD